jgi:hypothetical protein
VKKQKNRKQQKISEVQMQYSFSYSFSIWYCLIKEEKKIKRKECLSEAVAHLPPTVSHLLLHALFI